MTAPRRLQLRRGNTAATSTYVGAPGELVVNTTTNTLYLHDGSTVGGFATTSNITAINNQISSVNANITLANTGMRGYVDTTIAANIANIAVAATYSNVNVKAYTESMGYQNFGNVNVAAYVTTANSAIIGYIDQANTIQSAQVGAANLAITAANVGMKGYVDSQSFYSNAKVATYLQSGNISNVSLAGNVTATYFLGNGALLTGIVASSGGTNYSNTNVIAYLNATGYNLYSNANVASYLPTYSGNIANVRLGSSGVLTFADGTTMTTAASGGGSNYGNANVTAYTVTMGFTNYSNVNVSALITTNGLTNYSNVNTAAYLNSQGYNLYSNANVASYLPTYSGNISNVRLGTSGILTFPDGTQQTTAAFGGGGNYGNANVAAFLPTYTGTTGITQIGTLATLSVSGNATVGNLVGTEANTRIIANVYTTTFDIYGNVTFPGNIITPTGLYVGPTLFTALPTTIAQFTGNANSYVQINFENLSSGTDATADYVATANNGTDTTFFVDLGIANNNYDNTSPNNSLGTAIFANDSYLYAQGNLATTTGGNLIIGTSTANKSVKIFAGGINSANIVATVSNTGVAVTGNVSATNFVGSGSLLSGVATKITGSWTVPTGNSTQSFTVASGTYQLWVDCNIPNGILAWNATATVTNSNVPVVGQQFAWVYNGGGTPIDFTSIPNQFVGTGNTIVRSSVSPSVTTNRFDFGINNTSGGNVTVSYGYVKIS